MKKIIFIGLLFFSHCSSPKRGGYFDLSLLEKMSQLSLIEPPPAFVSFTPIYVVGNSDSISESSFVGLKNVYQVYYASQYSKFADFLFDALNQKIKIDTKNAKIHLYFSQSFVIEPNIRRLYKEKGIKGLTEMYCADNNGFYTLNKGSLKLNEINSISYYLFLHQYIRVDDDYEATTHFQKLTSMIN